VTEKVLPETRSARPYSGPRAELFRRHTKIWSFRQGAVQWVFQNPQRAPNSTFLPLSFVVHGFWI